MTPGPYLIVDKVYIFGAHTSKILTVYTDLIPNPESRMLENGYLNQKFP